MLSAPLRKKVKWVMGICIMQIKEALNFNKNLKTLLLPSTVVHAYNPSTMEENCEFETSLDHRDPVSKKTKPNKQKHDY
jgi:hypothetical protein